MPTFLMSKLTHKVLHVGWSSTSLLAIAVLMVDSGTDLDLERWRGRVEHPDECRGEELSAIGLAEECVGVALLQSVMSH